MKDSQFEQEVFPAEQEEIRQRRRQLEQDDSSVRGAASVDQQLSGLALSGGGIRSATFSLGVIQALVEKGKFKFVDYISTVSGGGYIGSCVSSVLNHPDADDAY